MDLPSVGAVPAQASCARPLIAHVIFRLGIGGLENGVVNLVNRLPVERFRHAIICLTDYTDFRDRITRTDVQVYAMHKPDGHGLTTAWKIYRLFRSIRPTVVHTRNLGCLEAVIPAYLAGVPIRIHGEHGWDQFDLRGNKRRYQWLRRLHEPWVDRFVSLTRELEVYLIDRVGIQRTKVTRLPNGVDTARFRPHSRSTSVLPPSFIGGERVIVGTVGRMYGPKDQTSLAQAFVKLCRQLPEQAKALRLVMVGEGPLRDTCKNLLNNAGLADQAWLPGSRDDVPAVLQQLDVFVLPSQAEGLSNTILEAMATGLPVVATAVGGNMELVDDGQTGVLVPPSDPAALAAALYAYVRDPQRRRTHGMAARRRVEQLFSLQRMVARYAELYSDTLHEKRFRGRTAVSEP